MPYIKSVDRKILDSGYGTLLVKTPGELNYMITKQILMYLPDYPSYDEYNTVVGVLECVKQEYYRRMVAPYEDIKKEQNGDVYP
jgi:hypothetical protein